MATTEATTYDRATELKAFDQTKSGVQGLVDAGIQHVPASSSTLPKPFQKLPPLSNFQS
ncbi:hypothetical protein R6Q57_006996 [Mikania cordata]